MTMMVKEARKGEPLARPAIDRQHIFLYEEIRYILTVHIKKCNVRSQLKRINVTSLPQQIWQRRQNLSIMERLLFLFALTIAV
jgi:hypothetical protein